jgi:hypothetical protein
MSPIYQAAVRFSKFAFKAISSQANPFQVLPMTHLNDFHAIFFNMISPFHPLNNSFAAQHRLVNEKLATLAQRIHGFTVETVKP